MGFSCCKVLVRRFGAVGFKGLRACLGLGFTGLGI